MTRRVLNVLTMLSLLLCAAMAALWVGSYRYYNAVGFWPSPARRWVYGLMSNQGTVCFFSAAEGDGISRWRCKNSTVHGYPRLAGWAGFVAHRNGREVIVGVPHWSLCLLSTVPVMTRPAWRSRRRDPGLCPRCGYDLRATPNRCPECGAAAAGGTMGAR